MNIEWNTETGEVTETISNKKLIKVWEDVETRTMSRVAYYIRSQEDYNFVVSQLRDSIARFKGCVGAEVAMENLLMLPRLMKGYKEKFILNAF